MVPIGWLDAKYKLCSLSETIKKKLKKNLSDLKINAGK